MPPVVLAISLLVTAGVAAFVYRTGRTRDRLRFEHATVETRAAIEARLQTYIAMLRGGTALFAGTQGVTRREFRRYIRYLDLERQYPGIQGIGFAVRVPPGGEDSIVAAMTRQGTAGFRIWPAGPRPERYAIMYLEPLDRRNRAALGYDMFSEPVRRAAMERARDQGRPAASGRVTLVQEIDENRQAGFLIYVPVYRGGEILGTLQERRDSILGFVYSPFRADDLFRGIFGAYHAPQVDFRLYDAAARTPEHLLHDSRVLRGAEPAPRRSRHQLSTTVDVAGRAWGVDFTAGPTFDTGTEQGLALLIVAGGLLVSAVLFGLSRAQLEAQQRIAQAAADLLRSEQAVRQAQKLESIGLLAGGIAHDFNNLLTGILGNATLATRSIPRNDPAQPLLEDVIRGAERAADLTGQLLAYAGKGKFHTRLVDVCDLIRDLASLLRTSISKKVRLDLDLGSGCGYRVEADPTQLQQLLMNLVINGAEAIGEKAGSVVVAVQRRELESRPHVEISVTDTGSGMDDATVQQIFDPFFTTKFMGRGLGLAAAQGIARSHGGTITVRSAPGQGSTFSVALPIVAEMPRAEPLPPVKIVSLGDGSTKGKILVVEDEDLVLRTDRIVLERRGYSVVAARDGGEAIEVFRSGAEDFALVLLDLTLPVMGGEEVVIRMRQVRSDVPVIVTSGYGEDEALARLGGAEVSGFLQKPYTADALTDAVASALRR